MMPTSNIPTPDNTPLSEETQQYTGIMSQTQDRELIEWLLSPEDMIDKFVNQFAGRTLNLETALWEEPVDEYGNKDVIMNESGIRYWKAILLGVLNRNTIMTRYDSYDQIRRMVEPLIARAFIIAELDKARLGMKSMHIDMMREALSNQAIATMLRGLKGGERDFLNLTTQLKQTIDQPQKQGLLGGLLGFKK